MATSTIKDTLTDLRNSNPSYNTTAYNLLGDTWYWDKADTTSKDDGLNVVVTTKGKRLKRKVPVVQPAPTPIPEPIPNPTPTPWYKWANENETVVVPVNTKVRYGANTSWIEKIMSGTVTANNATFGDPIPGVGKILEATIEKIPTAPPPVIITNPIGDNIDVVTRYGLRTGTTVDNTAALFKLNEEFKGFGRPLVQFDFSKLSGELRFNNNRWLQGIYRFIVNAPGIKFVCTSNEPFDSDKAAIFNEGIYFSQKQILNPGYRFKTVNKGSYTIELLEAGSFAKGDRLYLAGFEEQGYGWPVNPRFFEWKIVDSVSGGTITFTEPLKWGYNELWKDWDMWGLKLPDGNGSGPFGKPRIYKIHPDYPEYAKFIGCELADGINLARSPLLFHGMEVIYENCKTYENQPSECKKISFINCDLPSTEPDKNVELCEFINCNLGGLSAGTGIDILKITGGEIKQPSKLSPRELWIDGVLSKVTTEHNFQPNPEPVWIEKVYIKNNTFDGPNKHVEFSGTWVVDSFSPTISGSDLILPDNSTTQIVIRKLGFGGEVIHSDGSVKAIVKDIMHNGNWVIQLTNIAGTLKGGTWYSNKQPKVIDLGNNKSLSGKPIY